LFLLKYLVYIKKFGPSPLRFLHKKSKKKIINIEGTSLRALIHTHDFDFFLLHDIHKGDTTDSQKRKREASINEGEDWNQESLTHR